MFANFELCFTDEHIITLKYIKLKFTEHLKVYASKLWKAKGNKQQNMKIWLADNHELMDFLKKTSYPSSFGQDEKNFYFGQQEVNQCLKGIKDEIEKNRKLSVEILYHCHASGSDEQRPHL